MRALVLGAPGAVCKETTRDLAATSSFDEIVAADYNLEAAEALVAAIGDPRLQARFVDANDYDSLLKLFPDFDVVVNGLPFKYDYVVNKACVEAGVSGLDLSSGDQQFALHPMAEEKGILFVPGVGATPGITNLMVRRASERLNRLDEVEISFAAFRCLAPAPGLLQTTLWEFDPEVEARQETYFEDGSWHHAAPLTGKLTIRFHDQIGEQDVYYVPHDESDTLPRSFKTLRRAAVRGCFPPHVMRLMRSLTESGLLSQRPVRLGDVEAPAIEFTRALLAGSPVSRQNPVWAYGLVVEVTGEKAGRAARCVYRNRHPPQEEWGGEAAYYKNVGVPLSIGAQLMAGGQGTGVGVLPPERALPSEPFFDQLARRGIVVEETIIEEGTVTG